MYCWGLLCIKYYLIISSFCDRNNSYYYQHSLDGKTELLRGAVFLPEFT